MMFCADLHKGDEVEIFITLIIVIGAVSLKVRIHFVTGRTAGRTTGRTTGCKV